MDKLPRVFQNKVSNLNANDQESYYSSNRTKLDRVSTINVSDIFDKKFMYKRKVRIILIDDHVKDEYIVSKNRENLITINNEKISIEKIKSISLLWDGFYLDFWLSISSIFDSVYSTV